MESSVLNFQNNLKTLTFKTFYRNQTQQFDYDDLFADRRVLVFSIPIILGNFSVRQLKNFHNSYERLTGLGLDDIYCISSSDLLIGPWSARHSGVVRGLPDMSCDFVKAIATEFNFDKPILHLSAFWQYMVIINNGQPEKFWQNPVKSNMQWHMIKNKDYAYHGLTVEQVEKYLLDNSK